jgi:hypothetical protein
MLLLSKEKGAFMIKAFHTLLLFIFFNAIAETGPNELELDKNDPTKPKNVLDAYSLPEQKEEVQEQEEVEKRDDIQHTQEELKKYDTDI